MNYIKELASRPLYAGILVYIGVLLFLYNQQDPSVFYTNEKGNIDFKSYGVTTEQSGNVTMCPAGVIAGIIAFFVYIALSRVSQ